VDTITRTGIWQRTLAELPRRAGKADPSAEFRTRLRQAYVAFRDKAIVLANEVAKDLPSLTVHDATHLDALWQVADQIVGEDYPFTPTEAFVLGGAFLLHDLGMALASYPAGAAELDRDPGWRDAVSLLYRRKLGRAPSQEQIAQADEEIKRAATEQLLRLRHAEQAERLAEIGYQHTDRDPVHHLIEDVELRQTYGSLIGRIAYSHWWPVHDLPKPFDKTIGTFPGGPPDWTIDPLKLALVVRVADACHLDARRAPGFLRALRRPTGESDKHWRFQGYVQGLVVDRGRVVFSSTRDIPIEDSDVWWLGYEMVNLADRELHDADMVLRDTDRKPFAAHAVAGANDPTRLTRHIPTKGWKPVPTRVHVSDVAGLVRNLGGIGLYGRNPRVPLRELIQNARDAIVARRLKEDREETWGEIVVRLVDDGSGQRIEVQDSGVGMSEELLAGPFLDFGASYWNSSLMLREHPGLAARGFESQGRYGIGFFSVFMWGERVQIITRRSEDGFDATRVLEFRDGLFARPVLRPANPTERLKDPGTVIHVWLDRAATDARSVLGPGPIPTWFGNMARSRTWSLKDLCAWLCPALDVGLVVEQDGKRERAVAASDWKTISGSDLLQRLLLHRDDAEKLCADRAFKVAAANVRDIRDEDGTLLGRGALIGRFPPITELDEKMKWASAITAGLFRSHEQIAIAGLLLGEPEGASRSGARASALADHLPIHAWASEQADLIATRFNDPIALMNYAQTIRSLAGDTRNLPIARAANGGYLSFNDIASRRDLPDEIQLHADAWGVQDWKPEPLPENGIAVGSGRMKVPIVAHGPDPRRRADHPRWKQFWMSLWGATIEAISKSWGISLQQVLEASEVNSESHDNVTRGGRTYMVDRVDIIRKPRDS
jgi:hypothetical protein